jgi:hypothetical protein
LNVVVSGSLASSTMLPTELAESESSYGMLADVRLGVFLGLWELEARWFLLDHERL